jgi:RNA polymerase sigma-70 factor (ECF subfamily)
MTGVRQTAQIALAVDGVARSATTRDDALVARARSGDRDAFALLLEPRAQRLLRTARAVLGNEADASEAAQEALIAAWVQLPTLRDAERFDAWLNRTLVNKCRDALRKRKRVREIDLGAAEFEVPDTTDAHAAQSAVLAAFDRLPVHERHILVLHHLDALSLAEIASLLQIPVGTAKSRLWTARRHLEQALEAEA